MVLEHALLRVRAGEEQAFERAMAEVVELIAASPGFLGLEVRPASQESGLYLLLVRWERIEDHRDGFRRSERYEQWRARLHGFYPELPAVTYFGKSITDA